MIEILIILGVTYFLTNAYMVLFKYKFIFDVFIKKQDLQISDFIIGFPFFVATFFYLCGLIAIIEPLIDRKN